MKILYTQKGNTVYIDDDKIDKFNGHTLYENNGRIRVYKGKDCGTLPKFLFDYGEDVISRRKNIDIYDFRKSNMIFKQKATFGSYDTYEKAAIIRNCYIIENRLDRKLVPLDIPIEKQFELRKDIRTVVETRRINKKLRDGGK